MYEYSNEDIKLAIQLLRERHWTHITDSVPPGEWLHSEDARYSKLAYSAWQDYDIFGVFEYLDVAQCLEDGWRPGVNDEEYLYPTEH